jgi:NhaA family Na+:H+ antiporter
LDQWWFNDDFLLLIGLELEREIHDGELSNLKDALLPIFAALGGMAVPAGLYLLFNYGQLLPLELNSMATDIALL